MNHYQRISFLLFLAFLVFLSACSPKGEKEPTLGAEMVYTSAAQTVQVQLTQNAAQNLMETDTVEAPTQPNAEITAQDVSNTPSATFAPQTTPTFTLKPIEDKVEYISQNITDGSIVSTNQSFEMIWEVRNVGQTTWNTDYQIRFYAGDRLGASLPQNYPFTAQVGPNETYQVVIPMQTESALGQVKSTWVLTNDEGVNFYPLYVTINIAMPTATQTPTDTLEPTVTDTPTITPTL